MTMKENNGKSKRHNIKNNSVKNDNKNKPKQGKCDLGPDFIAPDGGWAWIILIAAGCSNVSKYLKINLLIHV